MSCCGSIDLCSNRVVWCVSGGAFSEQCTFHSANDYRVAAWTVTPVDPPCVSFDEHVSTVYLDLSGDMLGNRAITFVEHIYGNDASNQPIHESTKTDIKNWTFVDSSFAATLRWTGDGSSNRVRIRMDENALVRVQKPHNDAACDNIQIVCDTSAVGVDTLGIDSSSPDVVIASFDYAKKFNSSSQSSILVGQNTSSHVLSINDASFTASIHNMTDHSMITDTSSLREQINALISEGEFVGFSMGNTSLRCNASLSEVDISFEKVLAMYFIFF